MTVERDQMIEKRPTGRRPGVNSAKFDILRAARAQFAARGFSGATIRTIAEQAGVDSALIRHYFGSKAGLFEAAVADVFGGTSLIKDLDGDAADVASKLVERYLNMWSSVATQEPLMAILRSAIESDQAREALVTFFAREIYGSLGPRLSEDDGMVRVSLIGSQLVGVAVLRYLFCLEPLASLEQGALAQILSRTVAMYIMDELPQVCAA